MSKAKKTTKTNATTKTKTPKGLVFIDANGVEHAPDSEEALERLLPQRPKNETTAQPAPKGKRARKGATETPTEVPAPDAAKATGPANAATDGDEEVVFAFRLKRSDRDAIHAAAGSAKASKFVKGLAVAAARGDIDTIHTIVAEVVNAKRG